MTFAELLNNQPPPKKDLTSALAALRVLRNAAVHSADFKEFWRLSKAGDDLEAYVFSHASAEELTVHLARTKTGA